MLINEENPHGILPEYLGTGAELSHQLKAGQSDETILYIHGLGESGLCFASLVKSPRLFHWNHYIPDLAGYGKSTWQKPTSLREHAELLKQWCEIFRVPPLILVGHSMGGVIGQIFCEQYPERVRAFVNVEGNISLEDCSFSSQVLDYTEDEFVVGGFAEILEAVQLGGTVDASLQGYYSSMRLCDPRTFYLNSLELVEASKSETLAQRLSRLEIPVRYISGNPRGTGAHSRGLLADAGVRCDIIENAGHWPFLDQPEIFIDRFIHFLNSI